MRALQTVPALYRRVASTFLVMLIALAMVVTAPSNAHALSEGDTLTKAAPRVFGALKTASPTIGKNLVNFLPGGFLVKGLRLGMLAWATSDLWMPFFQGDLGKPPVPGDEERPTAWASQWKRHHLDTYTRTGNSISASYSFGVGPQQDWYAKVGVLVKCKRESDSRIGYRFYGGQQNFGNDGEGGTFGWSWPDVCPGDTLVAWKVGGGQGVEAGSYTPNLDTSDPQPARMNEPQTQYDKATQNYIVGGDWAGSTSGGFDPRGADMQYKGRAECIDGAGKITWAEGDLVTGDAGGVKMPSCEARGLGHGTGKTQVVLLKPDGTQQTVWDVPVAPMDPATPLCDPGRAGSGCVLEVLKDGQPCATGDVECENWASEKSKDPTRWKCKFGPYTLPLSACNALEQAYRPGGAITTDENTDGDPATRNDNDLSGQPVPQPLPGPIAGTNPGTTPGNAPAPGAGGSVAPGPSGDPEARQCFPTGWAAFNPVEWVMKPVSCALSAAFVPTPATVQTRTDAIKTKFENVGFARITTAWMATFQAAGGGSGCAGPTVNFQMSGVHQTLQPFNACSAPMNTVAGVSYGVSAIAMVLFGGLGIARAIAAGFGFNFSMGKGSDS